MSFQKFQLQLAFKSQKCVVSYNRKPEVGQPQGITQLGCSSTFWHSSQPHTLCVYSLCPQIGFPLGRRMVASNNWNGDRLPCAWPAEREKLTFSQCGMKHLFLHLIGPTWSHAHHSLPKTVTRHMPSAHWLLRTPFKHESSFPESHGC